MTPRRADVPTPTCGSCYTAAKTARADDIGGARRCVSPVPRDADHHQVRTLPSGPRRVPRRKVVDVVEDVDTLEDVGALTAMLVP